MHTDQLDLVRQFREMSDAGLVYQCGSGSLTEVAQSIAIEELTSRGLELPDPIATADASADYEGDFVTVARFLDPTDAHVVCSCLEAGGVPAFVADANLVQMHSLLGIAVGGVRPRASFPGYRGQGSHRGIQP